MSHSTSLNRYSENIIIHPVIISELKFSDVQRQVFGAAFGERADDTAFEDAQEAFNRLSMYRADDVLMLGVVNGAVIEFLAKVIIADPLIGAEQANLVRHGLIDESLEGRFLQVVDNATDYVALTTHSADDNALAGSGRTGLAVSLFPMPVLGLAADECFVNFDDAAKLGFGFDQSSADFVTHGMRGFVRPETHMTLHL